MTQDIKFGKNKSANIFSDIADEYAKSIRTNNEYNKTTQIRKFYDELAMWNDKVQQAKDKNAKFAELLPFIKMLKAKVAYAKGRKHIDEHFVNVFNKVIDEINDIETLRDAKLFMEAFIGYCKFYESNKNKS